MDWQCFPNEIFIVIASFATIPTISRIARTNRTMRSLLADRIYTMDLKRRERKGRVSRALRWALFAARDFHEQYDFDVDMTVVFAVARKAIAAGADVNIWVEMGHNRLLEGSFHHLPPTLLGIAASTGVVALAQLLLDAGADVNAGYPPIHAATAHGKLHMMKLLFNYPNIRLANFHTVYTSLLSKAVETNSIDAVRLVIPLVGPRTSTELQRETPIHNAVLFQNPEIVAELLRCEFIDPDTPRHVEPGPRKTPFTLACCLPNIEIVRLLHDDLRVNVDSYVCRLSPIYFALMHDQYPAAEFLIQSRKAERVHYNAMLFFIERNMLRRAYHLLFRLETKIGPQIEILIGLAERKGHHQLAVDLRTQRDQEASG